ncbi:hypothetical protein A1A1_03982 [Planococcus antarcticus DSM 14505]|uniref:DUF1129 domain-containing protein n=1 Tax=Planococcus antarcticus DSM 14505 TaxID=1185653 RepID=A0A1C7DGA3_9BACL|nr:DUF1129 family protein [Planococcus antarcticus]ANU10495.1 hypothetical protein BBH88_09340 [Planococcus antarcticus DSM 14505]EIM07765.1 hypothetical protein A1A1_03982 [Planococcus antarcticus DSM 14505]
MRGPTELIKENNDKRELLNTENERVYEDLLVYIRTDLRVDEHASEEILMDLLDHLLEAQEYKKNAADLFGDSPQAYADELIANLPSQKRRNIYWLAASGLAGLVGWFAITYGIINVVFSTFTAWSNEVALGSILLILLTVSLFGTLSIRLIFKIIRSSIFKPKNQQWKFYVKSGLYGMVIFAFMLGIAFLFDGIGPVVHVAWWAFLLIGIVMLGLSKGFGKLSSGQ